MTRFSGVTTSAGREATPRRGKEGNDASWADANLTALKNEENTHDRFSWYKSMEKI
jgi:hypothetical protein